MARKQNPQRQPSSLEKRLQSQKDKKMGIFRKTKKEPKEKTPVVEFDFTPAWNYGDYKPGEVIPWGRRIEKDLYEEWNKAMEKRRMSNTIQDAIRRITDVYPDVMIEASDEPGFDGVLFRIRRRGERDGQVLKLSNTFLASSTYLEIALAISNAIDKPRKEYFDAAKFDEQAKSKMKTPTDEWAEKWAENNS